MTLLNKITFCINTARNELENIKLLFRSFRSNLSKLDHEFLVFIDSDNEGTFEWLLTQKEIFPNLKILRNTLPIPYGYARNINEMFLQASNDIVSYLQSDMVVCKDYDLEVLKHLQPGMILCSTRVEPPLHPSSGEKHTIDFGLDPATFNLEEFTAKAEALKTDRTTEFFFAPFTLYKDVWNNIGGHDTLFRRSREDSDVLIRLVLNSTKIVQIWNAVVYHFTCTSSRGKNWFKAEDATARKRVETQQIADSIELNRLYRKWGKFSHNLEKLPYYEISAKISGTNLQTFAAVEPFFSEILVDEQVRDLFLAKELDKHAPANTLLNISDADWEKYSYMYRQEDLSTKFTTFPTKDIILEFALEDVNSQNFQEFILNLQAILDIVEEPGLYEFDKFRLSINKLENKALNQVRVKNPVLRKEHMYLVY